MNSQKYFLNKTNAESLWDKLWKIAISPIHEYYSQVGHIHGDFGTFYEKGNGSIYQFIIGKSGINVSSVDQELRLTFPDENAKDNTLEILANILDTKKEAFQIIE